MKKFFKKIGNAINDFTVNTLGKNIGKGASKIVNNNNADKAAGFLNRTIIKGKELFDSVKNADYAKFGRGISESIFTDTDSYKKVGNIGFSKKPLFTDALQSEIKEAGDIMASAFNVITKEGSPFQLLNKVDTDKSLLGWRLNGRGTLVAGGIMTAMNVPKAGKEFINSRRGYNASGESETSAPRLPAYADNAGATGDLVFALNNLRHGGMM